MPPVIDDAVCIRQWDWSETSQTVTLFCRTLGVVRGLAKGAKRPKSGFSGGLEPLTRGQAGVIIRRNSDLALITEWDLAQTFPAVRRDLAAHHAGLYFADLVHQFVRDHDPHPALFDALILALSILREGEPVWGAIARFQLRVLVEAGFAPVLNRDARTGAALLASDDGVYVFEPESGGLVNTGERRAGASAAWKVRAATVDLLRELMIVEVGRVIEGLSSVESCERAARLLGVYIRYVLGDEPVTHAVVFGRDRAS